MSGEAGSSVTDKLAGLQLSDSNPDEVDENVLKGHIASQCQSIVGFSLWGERMGEDRKDRVSVGRWGRQKLFHEGKRCALSNTTARVLIIHHQSKRGEKARGMMEDNFESEKIFHHYSPEHVPKPIAWGNYESDPTTWFYLCDFYEMEDELPDPEEFVSVIVQIHKTSMGKSPNGQYGFHTLTNLAYIPNENTWQKTWEAWFTQAMVRMFDLEEATQGKDERMDLLKKDLYEKVIPRLLRPLETGGRLYSTLFNTFRPLAWKRHA
ncbi:hypothetical protein AJ79_01162 [Helicocarpus griseus UAMH5409]|uniref:Protein-ribulosamine 3-kinase n=1 Tax=Helicocarpus griseus UAMH5409 TaxID=1447875 RepID=A0A2B7Y852_9EURO|nr:hypothetical protein AJ79_01162 [Helicocarpus griseus UAMH5409]